MFLLALCVAARCHTYPISAIDVDGNEHKFASIEWQDKSNMAKIEALSSTEFEKGQIKTFRLARKDGSFVEVPAPAATKSLAFRVSLIGETPVALEVTTAYRRQGLQISLNRAKTMPPPVRDIPNQEEQGPGGLMGLLSKFWFIPVALLVMNMMKKGQPAAAAPQNQ